MGAEVYWKGKTVPQAPFHFYEDDMLNTNCNHCFYCSCAFGTTVKWHNKMHVLRRVRDHFYPESQGGKLTSDNKVWSCQICNIVKSDHVFDTGTEAQNYVLDQLLDSDWIILE